MQRNERAWGAPHRLSCTLYAGDVERRRKALQSTDGWLTQARAGGKTPLAREAHRDGQTSAGGETTTTQRRWPCDGGVSKRNARPRMQ